MMNKAIMLGVGALLASGVGAHAAPSAAMYVAKAGASDAFEIKSSSLVLASTKNSGVRDFANQMLTDHAKSTADIKAAAKDSGITPKPPVLNAAQKAMIAKLSAAHGTARDKLYVSEQKASHAQALQLQQDYAQGGDKPALKTTAANIVPVVQHHIEMLNGMPAQ